VLTAFTAGLLLVTAAELGDKTFFIAMCLAMRHARRFVLIGVVAALATMTILSVLLGQMVSFLPKQIVYHAEILLFLGFGFKLLYDASKMPVDCRDKSLVTEGANCLSDAEKEALEAVAQAEASLRKKTPVAIMTEAFLLTFVAEWGDRTQFTTITLAASNDAIGVTLGAIVGHTICALIAIIGGRLIAAHISERTVTFIGGILFLVFAIVALLEGAG
jgi:Ca2+/H+ antiporter, TMEM165/GDT1 family